MSGGTAKTNASEHRYTFFVEWHDVQADLIRRYQLTFFLRDGTMEMHDIKNRRPFLKRDKYGTVFAEDLYLGAILNLHSRQLKLVEYGDVWTRNELEGKKSRTLALVKPDAYQHFGKIISEVYKLDFVISKMKMVKLTKADVAKLYKDRVDDPNFAELVAFMTSDVVVALEVVGNNAISVWRERIGSVDSDDAGCLRRVFGTDAIKNAVHGSTTTTLAREELELFFEQKWPTTALFNNCTCAILRPHCIHSREAGEIIDLMLHEGFEISALEMVCLSATVVEEFLEVYKGVLPEYPDMIKQMCSGPVIVMEVRQENAVDAFRTLCGPHDPEIARHLRPHTIRSKYGVDRVQNGLHCSDLPEDGLLEVEYFFNLAQ